MPCAVACRITWSASTIDLPLREHILRHALYRDGFLFEEADLLLRQELPDPRNYIAVLRAIAQGQTQNSKIANRTGLDDSQVSQTVKTWSGCSSCA